MGSNKTSNRVRKRPTLNSIDQTCVSQNEQGNVGISQTTQIVERLVTKVEELLKPLCDKLDNLSSEVSRISNLLVNTNAGNKARTDAEM